MIRSLGIKDESAYYWNNIIYLDKFDNRMLKITKRENRGNNNIYYISYTISKPICNINNLYFAVQIYIVQ